MTTHHSSVELQLPLKKALLPLLQRCVEESALAFGMGTRESLRLTLGAEEVYAFLLDQTRQEEECLGVSLADGGDHVTVQFNLPLKMLPLDAFNMVRREGETSMEGPRYGLFLAARMISSLEAVRDGDKLMLSLRQDRTYALESTPMEAVDSKGPWKIAPPAAMEANELAARAASYPLGERPSFVLQKGRAADLLRSPDWGAFAALDSQKNVGAGLFWDGRGKMAFLHGPWVFAPSDALAEQLVDACLGELFHRRFEGVVLMAPPSGTPRRRFEPLGMLPRGGNDGEVLYCSLREDNGGPLYVHPSLESFVRGFVDRLCLPRRIQATEPPLHLLPDRSALAVRMDPIGNEAYLSVLSTGKDGTENLLSHLVILREQRIRDIFFSLDLGHPDDVLTGHCLLEAGFRPRLLLPHAGDGDVLLFTAPEA